VRGDVVQRLAVGVDLSRLDLAFELRLVASHGRHLLLELVGDVDDERRPDEVLPVRQRVQDLEGTVLRHIRCELGEAREEARVADELGGDAMIGVASFERGRDHDARTVSTNRPCERRPCAWRVLDRGVGQLEVLSKAASDDSGGAVRFPAPQLGRAARTHLALGEVEDRRALPELGGLDERPAAGELDVVAMRGDGENGDGGLVEDGVIGWHRAKYRARWSRGGSRADDSEW
jgi:hypothetical protein